MSVRSVNYSLYLVTDSTLAILGQKDLVTTIQAAVEGGVTLVQLRDKSADTAVLVRIAKQLHTVTKSAGIPLLINDRVDVALAAGVEGVHIGQDDLDVKTARRILGPDAIIGVTASNEEEALVAARDGADYLGIGTVYATPTKENAKSIIGTAGVRQILSSLAEQNLHVPTVCIGGVNALNVQQVLFQTASPKKKLDGVAVVSAIMAASDAKEAASRLRDLIKQLLCFAPDQSRRALSREDIVARAPSIIQMMARNKPLCHNMTNLVVKNFSANVALAVGSSPIMSDNGLEAADLASLGASLVINMGTITPDVQNSQLTALIAYNAAGVPTLLDPVGAGATAQRRIGVRALMAGGYFDVIKGNESEIRQVSGAASVQQHGVDSGASTLSFDERVALVKATAIRERNVILMTGRTDIISDGKRTVTISNGHGYLGEITGSGCALGTVIASAMAVEREDKLMAAISGILMYEIAAERAAVREDVHGPGTFLPAFLDELYRIRQQSTSGCGLWTHEAKMEIM